MPTRRRHQETADPSVIPDKPYFKIGEAARLCAVKPYVLRYWETEFRSLRLQKTASKQRLYRRSGQTGISGNLWSNSAWVCNCRT